MHIIRIENMWIAAEWICVSKECLGTLLLVQQGGAKRGGAALHLTRHQSQESIKSSAPVSYGFFPNNISVYIYIQRPIYLSLVG